MVRKYHRPLSITKTESEWNAIDSYFQKGITAFLQREITKMKKRFDECPMCDEFKEIVAEGKKERRPYVSIDVYQKIEPIAKSMNVHPSTAVDILIIQPLLAQFLSSE